MVEVSVEHRVYIVVYESELDDDAVASEEELASQEQMDSASSLRLPDERELQYSLSSPSVASEQADSANVGCVKTVVEEGPAPLYVVPPRLSPMDRDLLRLLLMLLFFATAL